MLISHYGKLLRLKGWGSEDLADVSVALDLERQQVMITISDWDGVVVMDIVM